MADEEDGKAACGCCRARLSAGELCGPARMRGEAMREDRAFRAAWQFGGANQGAQFHQGLVEFRTRAGSSGADCCGDLDQAAGIIPKSGVQRLGAGIAGQAEKPAEDAHYVAVEDRGGLVERDTADGTGGVASDAWELKHFLVKARETTVEFGLDAASRGMQVSDTPVIAEASPEFEQDGVGRVGEVLKGRKVPHPALVVRDHGVDLGLLQHDFRDPDCVGIAGVAPGQGPGVS